MYYAYRQAGTTGAGSAVLSVDSEYSSAHSVLKMLAPVCTKMEPCTLMEQTYNKTTNFEKKRLTGSIFVQTGAVNNFVTPLHGYFGTFFDKKIHQPCVVLHVGNLKTIRLQSLRYVPRGYGI